MGIRVAIRKEKKYQDCKNHFARQQLFRRLFLLAVWIRVASCPAQRNIPADSGVILVSLEDPTRMSRGKLNPGREVPRESRRKLHIPSTMGFLLGFCEDIEIAEDEFVTFLDERFCLGIPGVWPARSGELTRLGC